MIAAQKEILKDIKSPVQIELDDWEKYYLTAISFQDIPEKYSNFLKKSVGKMIRPTIIFLISKACGKINDRTYLAALLVELMHNASLVHDDIIDNSLYRHNKLSFQGQFGLNRALLFGDYLVSKIMEVAAKAKENQFLDILINTFNKMAKGEIYQIDFKEKNSPDESVYYKIINYKTAALMSAACEMGCISSSAVKEEILCFRDFGKHIGNAYQIRDDMFDYVTGINTGKTNGKDISDKLITLPLLYSLENGNKLISGKIMEYLKDGPINNERSIEIIDFVQRSGGIEYANKKSEEYIEKARDILRKMDDSEEKESLWKLTDFIMHRKY